LRKVMREQMLGEGGPIQKVQEAAKEIDKAAKEAAGNPASRPAAPAPGETLSFPSYIWMGSMGALGFITQVVIILFLSYFLLVSGDLLKRKLIKIGGSGFKDKKVTAEILTEISGQISRFLQVQLFISLLVGVLSWLILSAFGLDHAAAWGVANA